MSNLVLPEDMPFLDFESLKTWLVGLRERKLGTTAYASVQHMGDSTGADAMLIFLYEALKAIIYEPAVGVVWFLPEGDDREAVTKEWLAAIARHNGINLNEVSSVVDKQCPVDLSKRNAMLYPFERERLEKANG